MQTVNAVEGIPKVSDLIELLKQFNPDAKVYLVDAYHGGQCVKELNYGPIEHIVTEEDVLDPDYEAEVAETIVILGFGNY